MGIFVGERVIEDFFGKVLPSPLPGERHLASQEVRCGERKVVARSDADHWSHHNGTSSSCPCFILGTLREREGHMMGGRRAWNIFKYAGNHKFLFSKGKHQTDHVRKYYIENKTRKHIIVII